MKQLCPETLKRRQIAIQAKVFGEIVRKLPEGDVVLETGDKDQATVRCKKTKYHLSVKSAKEYTGISDMERKIMSQFQSLI